MSKFRVGEKVRYNQPPGVSYSLVNGKVYEVSSNYHATVTLKDADSFPNYQYPENIFTSVKPGQIQITIEGQLLPDRSIELEDGTRVILPDSLLPIQRTAEDVFAEKSIDADQQKVLNLLFYKASLGFWERYLDRYNIAESDRQLLFTYFMTRGRPVGNLK